jgi:hypothetical protein
MSVTEIGMLGGGENQTIPGCPSQPRFARIRDRRRKVIFIDRRVCPGESVLLSRINPTTQLARWEPRAVAGGRWGTVSLRGCPEEVFVVRCPSANEAVNVVVRYRHNRAGNRRAGAGDDDRDRNHRNTGGDTDDAAEVSRPPHIVLLSLDAVSRAQDLRVMPRLRDALNDGLGQNLSEVVAANMTMYTAVGLNTHPNFAAILAGMPADEFRRRCQVTKRHEDDFTGTPAPQRPYESYFQTTRSSGPGCVPTLLERLRSEAGYRTMLMENVPSFVSGSLCELLCGGCSASVACYQSLVDSIGLSSANAALHALVSSKHAYSTVNKCLGGARFARIHLEYALKFFRAHAGRPHRCHDGGGAGEKGGPDHAASSTRHGRRHRHRKHHSRHGHHKHRGPTAMVINLTEGHVNTDVGAATIDSLVASFLRDIVQVAREGGREVVVAVLSDHGRAYGRYFATTRGGRLENKLPIMQLLVPRSVVPGGTVGVAALLGNQRRLASHFDLHRTVLQLAGLDAVTTGVAQGGGSTGSSGSVIPADRRTGGTGVSLFGPIPVTRSCRDAGVSADWCPCEGTWVPYAYTQDAAFLAVQALEDATRRVHLPNSVAYEAPIAPGSDRMLVESRALSDMALAERVDSGDLSWQTTCAVSASQLVGSGDQTLRGFLALGLRGVLGIIDGVRDPPSHMHPRRVCKWSVTSHAWMVGLLRVRTLNETF